MTEQVEVGRDTSAQDTFSRDISGVGGRPGSPILGSLEAHGEVSHGVPGSLPAGPLGVGVRAPDFELRDQNNQRVSLGSYRGSKRVMVVFFPLAFTGTCEGELGYLRDHLPEFETESTALLAVSVCPPPTHKVWSSAQGFLFPLLSDFWPHGATAMSYGVFNSRAGYANRGTFVVDVDGVITFSHMVGPGEQRGVDIWDAAASVLTA